MNEGILSQGQPAIENSQQPEQAVPGGQVPPEIQEQFDLFIVNGMSIIHDKKVTESILGRISASKNPIRTIADIVVDLVSRLTDSAKENQKELSNDVLVHGSNFLMGEIFRLTEQAGMTQLSDEEKEECFKLATGLYLDGAVKSGRMTKEQLVALSKTAKPNAQQSTEMMTDNIETSGILSERGV